MSLGMGGRLGVVATVLWLLGLTAYDFTEDETDYNKASWHTEKTCRDEAPEAEQRDFGVSAQASTFCKAEAIRVNGEFDTGGAIRSGLWRAAKIALLVWAVFGVFWFTIKWILAGRKA